MLLVALLVAAACGVKSPPRPPVGGGRVVAPEQVTGTESPRCRAGEAQCAHDRDGDEDADEKPTETDDQDEDEDEDQSEELDLFDPYILESDPFDP